jgi:hypothetical protein
MSISDSLSSTLTTWFTHTDDEKVRAEAMLFDGTAEGIEAVTDWLSMTVHPSIYFDGATDGESDFRLVMGDAYVSVNEGDVVVLLNDYAASSSLFRYEGKLQSFAPGKFAAIGLTKLGLRGFIPISADCEAYKSSSCA